MIESWIKWNFILLNYKLFFVLGSKRWSLGVGVLTCRVGSTPELYSCCHSSFRTDFLLCVWERETEKSFKVYFFLGMVVHAFNPKNLRGRCGLLLYTVWMYVAEIGWMKKLNGQNLDRIRLGRRAKVRMLGGRRAESGVLSRCREKQDGHAKLRKGAIHMAKCR